MPDVEYSTTMIQSGLMYLSKGNGARWSPRAAHCVYAFTLGVGKVAWEINKGKGECNLTEKMTSRVSAIHENIVYKNS